MDQGSESSSNQMQQQKQLEFEAVLPLLLEAERATWHYGRFSNDDVMGQESVHATLLKHGRCVSNIHRYFSNLESRKCCLNLAAAQTTFTNFRLVTPKQEYTNNVNGTSDICLPAPFVDRLSSKDLELYRHALMCAMFPVLGAPPPPADTPMPFYSASPDIPNLHKTKTVTHSTNGSIGTRHRSHHEIHRSSHIETGLDDVTHSAIPPETLCDLLWKAFGLSWQRAAKYERMVLEPYKKKSHARVLVEELSTQLYRLENDRHSYYNPPAFLTREAYEHWKQLERQHLSGLISKFWYNALPSLKTRCSQQSPQYSRLYKQLLEKLMRYEATLRGKHIVSVLNAPLSSASRRLLHEFGLRYGVGELTRSAIYLEYLSEHFEMKPWFIRHLNTQITTVLSSFPANRSKVIMIKEEYNLLYRCSMALHQKCEHALTNIIGLFTEKDSLEGIDYLIVLLNSVLELKSYLLEKHQNPVRDFLIKYVKVHVSNTYKQHKMVAISDLKMGSNDVPSPALLSRLIAVMQDALHEYASCSKAFSKFFDVLALGVQCFYILLMDDVAILCDDIADEKLNNQWDLRFLSLAYRLNKLDSEWKGYIPMRHQTWRQAFWPVTLQWLHVLRRHSERLIMQAVGADKFTSLVLNEADLCSPLSSRPSSTLSVNSLTQSERSAFEPVTPGMKRRSDTNPSLRDWMTNSMQLEASASFTPHDLNHTKNTNQSLTAETLFTQNVNETSYTYKRRPTFLFDEDLQLVNESNCDSKLQIKSESDDENPVSYEIDSQSLTRSSPNAEQDSGIETIASESSERVTQRCTESQNSNLVCGAPTQSISTNPVPIGDTVDKRIFTKECNETTNIFNKLKEQDVIYKPKEGQTLYLNGIHTQETVPSITIEAHISVNDVSDQRCNLQNQSSVPIPHVGRQYEETSNNSLPSRSIDIWPNKEEFFNEAVNRQTGSLWVIQDDDNLLFASMECQARSFGDSFQGLGEKLPPQQDVSFIQSVPKDISNCMLDTHDTLKCNKATGKTSGKDLSKAVPSKGNVATRTACESLRSKHSSQTPASPTDSNAPSQPSISSSLCSFSGVLPISSSLVDAVSLIKRIIYYGEVLSQTMYPLPDEDGSFVNKPEWLALQESSDIVNISEMTMRKKNLENRGSIYKKITQLVCNSVTLYADNLLCYDLCGTREHEANYLAGQQLLALVKQEHRDFKIWGCRHMAHGEKSCFLFVDKKTRHVADRFEQITEEMALRLNNLHSLLKALPKFQEDLEVALHTSQLSRLLAKYKVEEIDDSILEEFVTIETVHGSSCSLQLDQDSDSLQNSLTLSPSDMALDDQDHMTDHNKKLVASPSQYSHEKNTLVDVPDVSQPRAPSVSSSHHGSTRTVTESISYSYSDVVLGQCVSHLQDVQMTLANLIGYRINLFSQRALSLRIVTGLPLIGIEDRLQPVMSFLQGQLHQLHSWLYQQPYKLVVSKIWAHISENIKKEVNKLISPFKYSKVTPETLLQTIAHFIKFFDRNQTGLSLKAITQKVMIPMMWLDLYTQSTSMLASLHRHLYLYMSELKEHSVSDSTDRELLLRIRQELHGDNKCFSGRNLVDWLILHKQSQGIALEGDIQMLEQWCNEFAQSLLDHGILTSVEEDAVTDSSTPSDLVSCKVPDHPYPELSLDSFGLLSAMSRVKTLDSLNLDDGKTRETPHKNKLDDNFKIYKSPSHMNDKHISDPSACQPVLVDAIKAKRSRSPALNASDTNNLNGNGSETRKPSYDSEDYSSGTSWTTETDIFSMPTPSPTATSTFQSSRQHFYRLVGICDSMQNSDMKMAPWILENSGSSSEAQVDQGMVQWAKEIYELYDVTPQLVARILMARQATDSNARQFIKSIGVGKEHEDTRWDDTVSIGCLGCNA